MTYRKVVFTIWYFLHFWALQCQKYMWFFLYFLKFNLIFFLFSSSSSCEQFMYTICALLWPKVLLALLWPKTLLASQKHFWPIQWQKKQEKQILEFFSKQNINSPPQETRCSNPIWKAWLSEAAAISCEIVQSGTVAP